MTAPALTALRLALISMPWSVFNRPSLQLAVLKAYLETHSPCEVDCFHPYLNLARAIGTDTYTRIAQSGWAGEALFAPLLFPQMYSRAERLFYESFTKQERSNLNFAHVVEQVERSIAKWLVATKIEEFQLVGLSVCFFQLLPSLYLAGKIKEYQPDLPIVFGGSSCAGKVGSSLFAHFHQIDYLISGEGEEDLLGLCRNLGEDKSPLPGSILSRHPANNARILPGKLELNDLPYPNFSPYFKEMGRVFSDRIFIPILPVEFSRGCWWNKCTFCNLNLQWTNYRRKSGARMAEEILHLAKTHACLQFAFADNALPPVEADRFFTEIGKTGMDFDFFAELRVMSAQQRLALYHQAGLSTVQVGIEALSTTLLAKMAKGTKVMDNVAAMKMASSCGVHLEGNLITEFPGSTVQEIEATLCNLDFVLPFAPLQASAFFLGYGSPICAHPKEFAIETILPHKKNSALFPEHMLKGMTMLINSYRGDQGQQRKLWKPVRKKIEAWHIFHRNRDKAAPHPLHYRDGGSFLIIYQEQRSGPPLRHRLKGLSRKIMLFCHSPQTISDIRAAFPKLAAPALDSFIDEMVNKRLMFREDTRVLSLPVSLGRSDAATTINALPFDADRA